MSDEDWVPTVGKEELTIVWARLKELESKEKNNPARTRRRDTSKQAREWMVKV